MGGAKNNFGGAFAPPCAATAFMPQCLHSLSLYGTLLYRPVSTGNLCAEILSFVTA
jgi:hypothetical protein